MFYVSVEDAGRHVLALGPFRTHGAALERIREVERYVCKHDRKGHWYGYGTSRHRNDHPAGKLNEQLAYVGPGALP